MFLCAHSVERQGCGRAGRGASLRRSPLRSDCPAVLGRLGRRRTRFVRFAHCAQTTAASQSTRRASRAAQPTSAPRRLRGAPQPARPQPCDARVVCAEGTRSHVEDASHTTPDSARQAVAAGGDLCGAEEVSPDRNSPVDCSCLANGPATRPGAACKARAGGGARSALRPSDSPRCLSAVSEANEASFSARPRTEHRRAVGAKRRPPQGEPPPGTACRAWLGLRMNQNTHTQDNKQSAMEHQS